MDNGRKLPVHKPSVNLPLEVRVESERAARRIDLRGTSEPSVTFHYQRGTTGSAEFETVETDRLSLDSTQASW